MRALQRILDSAAFKLSNIIIDIGIESFWATLKRGIYGIYHHVSSQHLQKYVDEFCFRYNNRNNGLMFDQLLGQTVLGG